MAIPIIISTPMLNKLRTMFTKYQNTRRSEAILDLCEQNNYAQVAKNLSTYQKYQNVRIENYPFVYYLLETENVDGLQKFLKGIDYSKEVMNQSLENHQSKLYHLAYLKNNTNINALLKEIGFNLNHVDQRKRSVLHFAAMNNNLSLILKCLDNDINIDGRDDEGMTPLHYAAECGKVDAIQSLISNGAKVDLVDQENKYPVHYAILSANYEAFRILHQESKGLDYSNVEQLFITACQQTNIKILSELYKQNKGSIYHLGENNFSALHYAVFLDNTQLASFLLQNRALLNHQDEYGYTPIHLAVVQDHLNSLKYLYDKGGDLYIKAESGLNAIDSGMLMKGSKVQKFLKKIDMSGTKM